MDLPEYARFQGFWRLSWFKVPQPHTIRAINSSTSYHYHFKTHSGHNGKTPQKGLIQDTTLLIWLAKGLIWDYMATPTTIIYAIRLPHTTLLTFHNIWIIITITNTTFFPIVVALRTTKQSYMFL